MTETPLQKVNVRFPALGGGIIEHDYSTFVFASKTSVLATQSAVRDFEKNNIGDDSEHSAEWNFAIAALVAMAD